jgi:hypothetical protein
VSFVQVKCQVSSFNAQNCSMTAWAFSTLRHYHPALFDALLEQLAGQLAGQLSGGVEPQNIANSLWAFARAGHPLGVHTEPLVAAAKQLLPQMNQQELCNTAWALGVLEQLDRDTWQQFCSCLGNVQGWSAGMASVLLHTYSVHTHMLQRLKDHQTQCYQMLFRGAVVDRRRTQNAAAADLQALPLRVCTKPSMLS